MFSPLIAHYTGTLIENKTTWPHGLKAFGAALREHGMKLGTYTCVGPKTCGGCVASEGHEDQDVATFAEWGVEYLKVDSCSRNCTAAAGIPGGNKTVCGETLWSRYATAMKRHKTIAGEEMLYSIIGNLAPGRNGGNPPWKWGADVANSWRTNIDVQNGFDFLHNIVDCQRRMSGNGSWCPTDPHKPSGAGYPCADGRTCHVNAQCPGPQAFAGPGHWNDMDMLIIGTETNYKPPFCKSMVPPPGGGCIKPRRWEEMTLAQSRSQMSLWTILKSPLLISADLTDTDSTFVDVLANTEVLTVNDDPLGNEARRLGDSGYADKSVGEIYVGAIADGAHAVVMFNRNSAPMTMTLELADVTTTASQTYKVRDLWAHTDNGTVSSTGSVTAVVGGFDVVMITLRPSP
jgi:alpha-galactosidase